MKKFFLLTIAIICYSFSTETKAQSEIIKTWTCGPKCLASLNSEGKLTIEGTGPISNYGYRSNNTHLTTAPWGDEEYRSQINSIEIKEGITSVGSRAFQGMNNVTSLDISNTVTSIGDIAFANNNIENLSIPSSVKTIGAVAFFENNLSNLSLPNSLTKIGDNSFNGNHLDYVDIPNSVTYIGTNAFKGNNLSSVIIPDAITFVGTWAFGNNSNLREITISDNLTEEMVKKWSFSAFQEANLRIQKVICQGELDKCTNAIKRYLSPSCEYICLSNSVKVIKANKSQCLGNNYYWDGISCNSRKNGIICAKGFKRNEDFCNRIRYTPAEAAEVLHNDNTNEVTITFKK